MDKTMVSLLEEFNEAKTLVEASAGQIFMAMERIAEE